MPLFFLSVFFFFPFSDYSLHWKRLLHQKAILTTKLLRSIVYFSLKSRYNVSSFFLNTYFAIILSPCFFQNCHSKIPFFPSISNGFIIVVALRFRFSFIEPKFLTNFFQTEKKMRISWCPFHRKRVYLSVNNWSRMRNEQKIKFTNFSSHCVRFTESLNCIDASAKNKTC